MTLPPGEAKRRKKERNKIWYGENTDHAKAKANEWIENNRSKHNEAQLKWAHRNFDKRKDTSLKYRYGISLEQYEDLAKAQDQSCAICKSLGENLHVDHNHTTKEVRGLLCGKCNRGLGMFGDSIDSLNRAILYLEKQKKEK